MKKSFRCWIENVKIINFVIVLLIIVFVLVNKIICYIIDLFIKVWYGNVDYIVKVDKIIVLVIDKVILNFWIMR